jgi:hypothetical protein
MVFREIVRTCQLLFQIGLNDGVLYFLEELMSPLTLIVYPATDGAIVVAASCGPCLVHH